MNDPRKCAWNTLPADRIDFSSYCIEMDGPADRLIGVFITLLGFCFSALLSVSLVALSSSSHMFSCLCNYFLRVLLSARIKIVINVPNVP